MQIVNNTGMTDDEVLDLMKRCEEKHRKLLANPRPMTFKRRLTRAWRWLTAFCMDPIAHVEFDDADRCIITRTYWR